MDEDEVNPDDTEIWDAPEAPDNLPEVTHEAPETEVAELPEVAHEVAETNPVPEVAPVATDPETAFEAPEFESPEADELAEVTPVESSDDFAHEPPVFETESAEDLPGVSFETEEIPESFDDVGTEVADVTEVDDAEPEVTELDGDVFDTPDFAAAEVEEVLDTRPFNYQPESRQFPGPGHATANTYWMD